MAGKDQNSIWAMVWNYHDDNITGDASPVELTIQGIPKSKVLIQHYRVDQQFSNSFEKWKAMGKPLEVTPEQYQELEDAGQLQLFTSPKWMNTNDGKAILTFDMPRQAVSLVKLTW